MAKRKKYFKWRRLFRRDGLDLNPYKNWDNINWVASPNDLDFEAMTDRFKKDPIARKITSKPAEDATRNGWQVIVPQNPNLANAIEQKLEELQAQQVIAKHITFRNMHGRGYLFIGVREEGTPTPATPINPENIEDVAFLHAFGQTNVKSYVTQDDPTSPDYGKETALVIQPKQAGYTIDRYGNAIPNTKDTNPVVIDHSRYCDISLDKFEDDEIGTSIIQRCVNQLNVMSIANETVGKILREFTFKVVKSDYMMNEDDDEFKVDSEKMSQSLNTEATAFIGNEDDIVKLSTSTSGINDLLNFAWQDLAAASNIPKSVLTGEQAGTLAGASQDVVNYYDGIKAMQEQVIKPELVKIICLIMQSKSLPGGPVDPDSIDWHIEFNPLWTPDDKTQAEIEQIKTATALTKIQSGMYSADEVRQQFEAQSSNNIQGMQNYSDSADDSNDEYAEDEIKQYKKDVKVARADEAQ